jgi:hypothetical protein
MVDKKHKPGKLSYKNAAGEPIKGKATKPYEMQLPGDGKTVNLPSGISDSWKNIIQLIEQQRPTVELGTLYK